MNRYIKRIRTRNNGIHIIFHKSDYGNIIMLTVCAVFIFSISILGGMHFVNADNAMNYEKSFTSVEIEAGDTLTSIAQEYAISEAEYSDYVEEVKCINNLKSDVIQTGCYLLVPVYELIEE